MLVCYETNLSERNATDFLLDSLTLCTFHLAHKTVLILCENLFECRITLAMDTRIVFFSRRDVDRRMRENDNKQESTTNHRATKKKIRSEF